MYDAPSITATDACLGIPGRELGSNIGIVLIGGSDILPMFVAEKFLGNADGS
jgi:hypothetical protein